MHPHSFTLLRLFAAALVIVGHAYDLQNQSDIAKQTIGISVGTIGVYIFFTLSGYLIFNSASRNPEIARFAIARALRILPGLWIMLIVTTALLASVYSFDAWSGIKYVLCNASIVRSCYELPGVFSSNPNTAVNGSLWTLKFEVACYVAIGLLIVTGLIRRPIIFPIMIAAWFAFLLVPHPHPQLVNMHQLGGCFLLGMIASALYPPGKPPPQDIPDFSYGVYIYAFPIQQAIIFNLGTMEPMLQAALAFVATIIPAALSWHLIERPALRLKGAMRRHWSARIKLGQQSYKNRPGTQENPVSEAERRP